jgi:hypothetical protein
MCATSEKLEQFLQDRLAGPEGEEILLHVEECKLCQQELDRMTREAELSSSCPSCSHENDGDSLLLECLKGLGPPGLDGKPGRGSEWRTDSLLAAFGESKGSIGSRSGHPAIRGFQIIREVGRGGMA